MEGSMRRWGVLAALIGLVAIVTATTVNAAERSMACAPVRGILLPPLPSDDAGLAGPVGSRVVAVRLARGLCFAGPHEQGPAVYRRIIDTSEPEQPALKTVGLH
jgi:hypothetical protein